MTLKDLLEGYGIDFSTLDFKVAKSDDSCPCTKEEILKSIEENEIVFDTNSPIDEIQPGVKYHISDFDIESGKTTLYWD